jgi:hypothetical protein
MKKTLLSLFAAGALAFTLNAQYTFSESSGVYVPLSIAADTVTDSQTLADWDDDWVRVGMPFQVNMYGTWYDSLAVETNGSVVLFNDWTGVADPWYDVNDTVPCIMGFGEFFSANATGDLVSRGSDISPILMEVTGAPGVRILKIEWRNAGFYEDTSSAFTNFVNFQIWIHEWSGDIEFHYGTSYIDLNSFGGSTGPTIGIASADLTANQWDLFPGIYITGTNTTETAFTAIGQMTGNPNDSTIYFFTNLVTVGIDEIQKSTFTMYPNPAKDECQLVLSDPSSVVMITDASGRLISETSLINSTSTTINLSGYAPGLYFVSVRNDSGVCTKALSVR